MAQGGGGDEQVARTNQPALLRQVGADMRVAAGRLDAKIEHRDGIQYRLDECGTPYPPYPPWLGVGTVDANQQLRSGNGADEGIPMGGPAPDARTSRAG